MDGQCADGDRTCDMNDFVHSSLITQANSSGTVHSGFLQTHEIGNIGVKANTVLLLQFSSSIALSKSFLYIFV